jgi:hypothetical protein
MQQISVELACMIYDYCDSLGRIGLFTSMSGILRSGKRPPVLQNIIKAAIRIDCKKVVFRLIQRTTNFKFIVSAVLMGADTSIINQIREPSIIKCKKITVRFIQFVIEHNVPELPIIKKYIHISHIMPRMCDLTLLKAMIAAGFQWGHSRFERTSYQPEIDEYLLEHNCPIRSLYGPDMLFRLHDHPTLADRQVKKLVISDRPLAEQYLLANTTIPRYSCYLSKVVIKHCSKQVIEQNLKKLSGTYRIWARLDLREWLYTLPLSNFHLQTIITYADMGTYTKKIREMNRNTVIYDTLMFGTMDHVRACNIEKHEYPSLNYIRDGEVAMHLLRLNIYKKHKLINACSRKAAKHVLNLVEIDMSPWVTHDSEIFILLKKGSTANLDVAGNLLFQEMLERNIRYLKK